MKRWNFLGTHSQINISPSLKPSQDLKMFYSTDASQPDPRQDLNISPRLTALPDALDDPQRHILAISTLILEFIMGVLHLVLNSEQYVQKSFRRRTEMSHIWYAYDLHAIKIVKSKSAWQIYWQLLRPQSSDWRCPDDPFRCVYHTHMLGCLKQIGHFSYSFTFMDKSY